MAKPTTPGSRKAAMTGPEFRALRESTGLSVAQWATLLGCTSQSVRNMESGKPIGRQMAKLAMLFSNPLIRTVEKSLEEEAKKIMQTP